MLVHIAVDIAIVEDSDAVYIVWRPVLGAVLYRLQFLENGKIFNNATTRTASFTFSLSDALFKGKTFSVKVSKPANIYDTNVILKVLFADWYSL